MAQYHSVELEGLLLITLFKDNDVVLQLLIKHLSPLSYGEIKWMKVPEGIGPDVLKDIDLRSVLKDQGFNEIFFESLWVEGGIFLGEIPDMDVFNALGFEIFLRRHKADELWGENIRALNVEGDFLFVDSFYLRANLKISD